MYFEIGYDQGAAVKELLDIHGFKDTRVIQDLTGKDALCAEPRQTARRMRRFYRCLTVWMIY